MPAANMTNREKELLLEACMYRITPEQRGFLMREVPAAYNSYCGTEIVKVIRVSDGQPPM